MEVIEFINQLPAERRATISALHEMILANDPTVNPVVKQMMGKEMILYEERSYMKYGLASIKNYMSLHCLPMYMNPALHARYVSLFPDAKFQKGCINFTDGEAMPSSVLTALITECSAINIAALLENRKKKS